MRRLGQGRHSFGWSDIHWSRQVHIEYLDEWWRHRRINLDNSCLGRPMLGFLSSMTREVTQVQILGQRLPLIPSRRTSLGLGFRTAPLIPGKYFLSCNICASKNLRLQTVTSCAIASADSSGLSPHLARRQRVTKEWKFLSTNIRALWMRSRWNLLKKGRPKAVKQ